MEFMQSHLLLLPQAFSDLPSSKLVSYKEMTTTTDHLDDFSVTDCTTVDFASITHPIFCDFQFKGSHFQQLINARHLPLLFSYSSSFLSSPCVRAEPKLDFSRTSEFYHSVESSLLASANNSTYTLDRSLHGRLLAVGPDNPARWVFSLYVSTSPFTAHLPVDDSWICSYGQVKNSPLDANVITPVDGSNNTGEMQTIIELFDYILHYSHLPHGSSVKIFIDSTYVIRSLNGDQIPSTHHQLVELAQQYYTALRTVFYVELLKVPSHVGIPGNEFADSLAKRGVSAYGTLGRFSSRTPLNPPTLGYNSDIWLSKSPQEQSDFLCSLLLSNEHLMPTLPVSAKKPWISSTTLDLISQFQDCTDLSVPEVKSLRKRIKKSASRDKKQLIAQHLQDDFHGSSIHQWRTARSIRKPFVPRSVNLFNIHGKLTSKDLRATTFAEYLSEKVWKAPDPQPIYPTILLLWLTVPLRSPCLSSILFSGR